MLTQAADISATEPDWSREAKAFFRQGLLEVVLPRVPDMREKDHEISVKAEEE